MRCYVLVDTESGTCHEVRRQLQVLDGVTSVELVTGSHDLVVITEQPSVESIRQLLDRDIHKIPLVKSTTTMIVVNSDWEGAHSV